MVYGLILLIQPCILNAQYTKLEKSILKQGFVDIHSVDPTIRVNLMYGQRNNFCGKVLYKDLTHAFLHPKAAASLKKAQQLLKKKHPKLSLIVFDAARPMSIQQQMWNTVKRTTKFYYVSNPARGGGLHNYGLAVDVSICNQHGDTIPMGTKIDYMGAKSHTDREAQLVKVGKLSRQAMLNRRLLRSIMHQAGFISLHSEWWHFNRVYRSVAKKHYQVIK